MLFYAPFNIFFIHIAEVAHKDTSKKNPEVNMLFKKRNVILFKISLTLTFIRDK